MDDRAYQDLAEALDRLPNGYPRTDAGIELAILKRIFSPDQASLAAHLDGAAAPVAEIAERAGLPSEDLGGQLIAMVRRGLGWITVVLVVTTTLMFDIAQIASLWIQQPLIQIILLALLIVLFGWRPGFSGYRWHARALQDENFHFSCTVIADNRRQAIKAANDDHYNTEVKVVVNHLQPG